jgi:hypothetical protein
MQEQEQEIEITLWTDPGDRDDSLTLMKFMWEYIAWPEQWSFKKHPEWYEAVVHRFKCKK